MFDPEMTFTELEENIDFIARNELFKYGSGIIKKMRLETYTDLSKDYLSKHDCELELNNLEYVYKFTDERVARVYNEFYSWKNNDVYQLQSKYRGEVPNEIIRTKYRQELILSRKIEFDKLCAIVERYKQ